MKATYSLVVRIAERLAHQLGGPVFALAVLGLQTGDYERHVGGGCMGKGTGCVVGEVFVGV